MDLDVRAWYTTADAHHLRDVILQFPRKREDEQQMKAFVEAPATSVSPNLSTSLRRANHSCLRLRPAGLK